MSKDVAEEYTSSLNDLTVNSKPLINMLTMLAEDYIEHAPIIVKAVEVHLQKVQGDVKLPVLYLIDSIVKNVRRDYIPLFTQNIVSTFCSVFQKVDEKVKSQMFKLRQTWNDIFPAKKLYALDARVNAMDPEWPITVNPQAVRIHVNPKFFQSQTPTPAPPEVSAIPPNESAIQEEILKQRKELLELQKKKVELELIQTKAILEERQKKIENQTAAMIMKSDSMGAGSSTNNIPAKTVRTKYPKDSEPPAPEKDKPPSTENTTFRTRDPRIRVKVSNDKSSTGNKTTSTLPNIKIPKLSDQSSTNSLSVNKVSPSSSKNKREKKSKKSAKQHHTSKYGAEVSSSNDPGKDTHSHQPQPQEVGKRESKVSKSSEKSKSNDEKQSKTSELSIGHSPKSGTWVSDTQTITPKPLNPLFFEVDPQETQKTQLNDVPKEKISIQNTLDIIEVDVNSDSNSSTPTLSISNSPSKLKSSNVGPHQKAVEKRTFKKRSTKRKRNDEELPPMQVDDSPHQETICDASGLPMANNNKDIDLRLLPTHGKPLTDDEIDKIDSKNKMMENLFGPQDVDLRTFPIQPPTPPPPIISRHEHDQEDDDASPKKIHPQSSGNWANYKGTKPDDATYPKKHKKSATDRLGRPFFFNNENVDDENDEEPPEERASDNCNIIIQQAEEQLNSGNITFSQYNSLLKAVIKMNEERKLQEAVRMDKLNEDYSFASEEAEEVDENVCYPENVNTLYDERDNVPGFKRKYKDGLYNGDDYDPNDGSSNADVRKRAKFHAPELKNRSGNHRGSFGNRYDNQISSRPGNQRPWTPRVQRPHAPPVRGDYKHWSHPPRQSFEQNKVPFRYRGPSVPLPPPPPHINPFGPRVAMNQVPPADPRVLEIIAQDTMNNIIYEGVSREVRFYGDTAVILLSWDDPREVTFQPGSKTLVVDDREMINLQFNMPYKEFIVDGARVNMRLGAPTRELYIDGCFYEVIFGGPPLKVVFGGKLHSICLPGPAPQVKFSDEKRTDLVAGKVNLIVDANHTFPIYLDAKPQRFSIGQVPYILRFVEALQTVVINGVPFKIEFGGTPVPIFFQGEKHYLRLSGLPRGIKPGYINIINMEGGRLPSPSHPPGSQSPMLPNAPEPNGPETSDGPNSTNKETEETKPPSAPIGNDHSLELLASLMPSSFTTPSVGQSYSADYTPDIKTSTTASTDVIPTTVGSVNATNSAPDFINVNELLKKLVAVGIVPAVNKDKEKESSDDLSTWKPVDFSKPETLKVRQPALISRLYSGIQCSSCGVRFSPEETVKYSQHLDWHFRQNRRDRDSARIAQSRRWNYDVSDWIQYQEIEDLEERAQSWFEMQEKKTVEGEEVIEEEPSVVVEKNEDDAYCCICQDRFDIFYNEEKEEWHLRMAIRVDEKLYHPLCYKDYLENLTKEDNEAQEEGSYFLEDDNETIEIVDDSVTESTVISIDDDKSSKDETGEKEKNKDDTTLSPSSEHLSVEENKPVEAEEEVEDSDDDILQIEVIEPTIESFEILDEDDEEEDLKDENGSNSEGVDKSNADDEDVLNLETDFSNVVVKKEKEVVLPEPALVSHHTTIISSIDGNVELEEAAPIVQPKRININITSALAKSKKSQDSDRVQLAPNPLMEFSVPETPQPLPPGEELSPAYRKPKIRNAKLSELPPTNKGTELSGLCSVM